MKRRQVRGSFLSGAHQGVYERFAICRGQDEAVVAPMLPRVSTGPQAVPDAQAGVAVAVGFDRDARTLL
jgi:hypothetical protein